MKNSNDIKVGDTFIINKNILRPGNLWYLSAEPSWGSLFPEKNFNFLSSMLIHFDVFKGRISKISDDGRSIFVAFKILDKNITLRITRTFIDKYPSLYQVESKSSNFLPDHLFEM